MWRTFPHGRVLPHYRGFPFAIRWSTQDFFGAFRNGCPAPGPRDQRLARRGVALSGPVKRGRAGIPAGCSGLASGCGPALTERNRRVPMWSRPADRIPLNRGESAAREGAGHDPKNERVDAAARSRSRAVFRTPTAPAPNSRAADRGPRKSDIRRTIPRGKSQDARKRRINRVQWVTRILGHQRAHFPVARLGHTAQSDLNRLFSAESAPGSTASAALIYSPVGNAWTPPTRPQHRRALHPATRHPLGAVEGCAPDSASAREHRPHVSPRSALCPAKTP